MRTTIDLICVFYTVTDDCCPTIGALRGHAGDGAFKTVEHTGLVLMGNFKYFVVLVAAHIACCHGGTSNTVWTKSLTRRSARQGRQLCHRRSSGRYQPERQCQSAPDHQ